VIERDEREFMTSRIWIGPVKRPDGRNWYTQRGLLLRTRLGGPDGGIICDGVHIAVGERPRPALPQRMAMGAG
jgi:hypothetical protein